VVDVEVVVVEEVGVVVDEVVWGFGVLLSAIATATTTTMIITTIPMAALLLIPRFFIVSIGLVTFT
jgi:hypothetical protein